MRTRVAVIVLAAGRGSRFDARGRAVKAVAPLHGTPLVRTVVKTALESRAATVAVVTGPWHTEVAEALRGVPVHIVHNADFASGLASSLRVGLRQVTADIDGILVMLADMPLVRSSTLDLLMSRFDRAPDAIDAIVPVHEGRRGNPVLIGRSLFSGVDALSGDEGARKLLTTPGLAIEHCDVTDSGVTIDIDTPEDLAALEND